MKPSVFVALASFNGAKYIEDQIRSILSQSHRDLELIICDDGSTDGTREIIINIARTDSRVKCFMNLKRLGLVKNFLNALKKCRGEYILFSDQDDSWQPDKIETLLGLMKKNPKGSLAYSDLEVCDERLKIIHRSFFKVSKIQTPSGDLSRLALLKNIMPGCSMMFTKEVADKAVLMSEEPLFREGNFPAVLDETPFMHDSLIFLIAAQMGGIVYCSEKLMKYRQHAANSIGAFYEAESSRTHFDRILEKKIHLLTQSSHWGYPKVLDRARLFLEAYRSAKITKRIKFLEEFLFIRNAKLRDQCLGFIECLFPEIYQKLRKARLR